MSDPERPPIIHAALVAWVVLGTFLLIVGLLYLGAVFLVPWATPY
jgi:hypothetical protein